MPKEKEKRQINPATAALKAAKNRIISKQKAAVAAQRTERLSKRNPDRIKRQIEELHEQKEAAGGVLNARDRKKLEELERDAGRIERAREKSGHGADEQGDAKGQKRDVRQEQRDRRSGVLGKRGRNNHDNEDDVNGFHNRNGAKKRQRTPDSSTDEDAKSIPMPDDVENMPPVPRKPRPARPQHDLPDRIAGQGEVPPLPAQTVYSSAPQMRNLHKEAVSRFVPAAVASKLAAVKGEGSKLLEPEEADALEAAGYSAAGQSSRQVAKDNDEEDVVVRKVADEAEKEVQYRLMAREAEEGEADTLDEEAKRFEQELRTVEMEEVSDEDL